MTHLRLTDEMVLAMRKQFREDPTKNQSYFSTLYGISIHTIKKAMRGASFTHLNTAEPPVFSSSRKLTDKQVLALRRLVIYKKSVKLQLFLPKYAKKFNVALNTIEDAVRGNSYKHLNAIVAPTVSPKAKPQIREEVRALYLAGKTHVELVAQFGVAKSTVATWCSDLTEQRRQNQLTAALAMLEEGVVLGEVETSLLSSTKPRSLSVADVITIRRDVRAVGKRRLKYHAEKYGVSIASVNDAINGGSFKHVNAIEPPIVTKLPLDVPASQRRVIDETLVSEMLRMRREDSVTWSYRALALWMSEKTGLCYIATHISRLLLNRDPSLKDLERFDVAVAKPTKVRTPKEPRASRVSKPRGGPKPKVVENTYYSHECVVCEESFKSQDPTAEVCWRPDCKDVIEEENIRQAELEMQMS